MTPEGDPVVVARHAHETRPEIHDGEAREHRGDRGRDRDRGGRDRGERRDRPAHHVNAPLEAPAPIAETLTAAVIEAGAEPATKVDDVARAAVDRADRNKKRGGAKAPPAEENKEFWETWAETKTTRPEPVVASAAAEPATTEEAPTEGRSRDRKRGGRDRGEKRDTKAEKAEPKAAAKADEKPAGRAKRDTAVEPVAAAPAAAATADSAQARLFVNLGKKHGVSADDLRAARW